MMRLDDTSATNKILMENGCYEFDKYSIGLLILKAHDRYVTTTKYVVDLSIYPNHYALLVGNTELINDRHADHVFM